MNERPNLTRNIESQTFRNFYYLKAELLEFCRECNLPTQGNKKDLTERIAWFLETGQIKDFATSSRTKSRPDIISLKTKIEPNIICSEQHRSFFKEQIGSTFSFNVSFQRWLKANAGKTYQAAIDAYYVICDAKKNYPTEIDAQFEYNTYIRDFFYDNPHLDLNKAIVCWKYKKKQSGSHRYEKTDLDAVAK